MGEKFSRIAEQNNRRHKKHITLGQIWQIFIIGDIRKCERKDHLSMNLRKGRAMLARIYVYIIIIICLYKFSYNHQKCVEI